MNRPLRVLHLIDSLELGGAERVAVNLSNALNEMGIEAYLAASRKEGPLLNALLRTDRYIFLRKRHTLDPLAFTRLIQFVKQNDIQIIHAHSSSLGWAVLAGILKPLKVIWHNHNGGYALLARNKTFLLRQMVQKCNHVIAVNEKLAEWARVQLGCPEERVSYMPNFPDLSFDQSVSVQRPASKEIPTIVCTANLRAPKDHDVLIEALALVKQRNLAFKALFIGKDAGDAYSQRIKRMIIQYGLEDHVQILGSQNDVGPWLQQSDIGVLASSSEGLPVALLEYGLAGLPVVCTTVGECPAVLCGGKFGLLVPPKQPAILAAMLIRLIQSHEEREALGTAFQTHILTHYSKQAVLRQMVKIYSHTLNIGIMLE